MKKIFVFLICAFMLAKLPSFAQDFDLNALMQYAQENNIKIDEIQTRPFIGKSFDAAKNGEKPFLLLFVNFYDVTGAIKFINSGYQVYTSVQEEYDFVAINTAHKDNSNLVKRCRVHVLPYAYVASPKQNKLLPIKPSLYNQPEKLIPLLIKYAEIQAR